MHKMLVLLYEKVIAIPIVLKIQEIITNDGMEGCYSRYRLPSSKTKILENTILLYRIKGLGVVKHANAEEFAQACLNPENELLVLAHEYGHFCSYKDENWTEIYKEILEMPREFWPRQSLQHREAVVNEEKKAWDYAKKILFDIGFKNWDRFATKRTEALNRYSTDLNFRASNKIFKALSNL